MSTRRTVNEQRGALLQQGGTSLEVSRREFLARAGKSSAAAVFATCTSVSLFPSLAQAEVTPTSSTDELTSASATRLAKLIREKKVSSEEVVNAYLKRIEVVNPRLNAIVQLTAEAARAQAREADAALARGDSKGPLHGIPFTVKDTIETMGVICAAGTKGRTSFIPARDATTVARLRAAGAILLGKSNVPELGLNTECDNLVYGRTNNPYGLSHIPGGSSGSEPTARWIEKGMEQAGTTELHPWTQWLVKTASPNKIERDAIQELGASSTSARGAILGFLEKYDVVLCPVSRSPVPVRQGTPAEEWGGTMSYLTTYALLEVPTVVVCCGMSPEGLPVGVQVVTREWREDVAFAVAQHLETALGGWKRPQI